MSPTQPSSPSPSSLSSSSSTSSSHRRRLSRLAAMFPDDPAHPLQITLRTYVLTLSLSLAPVLTSLIPPSPSFRSRLKKTLAHELGPTGFAFAITVAVGGGAALQRVWTLLADRPPDDKEISWKRDLLSETSTLLTVHRKSKSTFDAQSLTDRITTYLRQARAPQRAFASNLISAIAAIFLLQAGADSRRRRQPRSAVPLPTLDLTLLLLVRAVDAVVQKTVFRRCEDNLSKDNGAAVLGLQKEWEERERQKRRRVMTTRIDALVFWACSARIMWCFFYEPLRLPRSYLKWITSLANVDKRLPRALRAMRAGAWSYTHGISTPPDLLTSFAQDLGHPASWGNPALLPAIGGATANKAWKALGVRGRSGLGGMPCEMVHGGITRGFGIGDSCVSNAGVRGVYAFLEAVAIYLPVHFLPILLTRPRNLLRLHRIFPALLGALRSATFLSTFVSSYWFTVCLTRTLVLARLLPSVSHDFWDGPYGCPLAGSLACGGSIWIENGRRRGEMALYVLPRAVRACLPDKWVRGGGGNTGLRWAERVVFVLSLSSLLTAAAHRPDSLRGLSRWAGAFIMNGPNAGFWKRRRQQNTSGLQTPAEPSVAAVPSAKMTEVEGRLS